MSAREREKKAQFVDKDSATKLQVYQAYTRNME